MDLLRPRQKANNQTAVRNWTRTALNLDEETVVMVSELTCLEDDCPPVETVIAIIPTGAERQVYKIHKSIDELDFETVRKLVTSHAN